ncbi:hypothetical protein V1503_24545 [Bacillus sp. SCS-151]|uniref:hypothetical protein n=1 Tax=Nanhaiella sioensis TaxID=3115293 RepID=UPI00397E6BFD
MSFITGLGISGCGKSSTLKVLGKLINFEVLVEPEEDEWPLVAQNRDLYGHFTEIMWFRSIRVPLLYLAESIKEQGKGAIVDSYYNKVLYHYFEKPGMEWFIENTDPYFTSLKEITKLDYYNLPNPDVLINFEIDYEDWVSLLKKRNRNLDNNQGFKKSYEAQTHILDAGKKVAKEFDIKLITFKQEITTPLRQAHRLKLELEKNNIIPISKTN